MSLPVLSKTWQFNVNQIINEAGDTNKDSAILLLAIKNSLKGFGSGAWTVVGSSNAGGTTGAPTGSAGLDAVDRWNTQADINTGGSNNRHAWIVLQQANIAANFQVCFDLNNTGSIGTMTLTVSPGAGFTGGSATAAPTATDGLVIFNAATWNGAGDTRVILHAMMSTDGQCTRLVMSRNGNSTTNFMLFDKPQNPVSGWTNPSISTALWSNTSTDCLTVGSLTSGTALFAKGASAMTVFFSGEGGPALLATNATIGVVPNEFDGTWPIYPVGMYSTTALNRGRHANVFDLWWKPAGLNSGDTFPSSFTNRQFVCFGALIFPWTGGADIPLLA